MSTGCEACASLNTETASGPRGRLRRVLIGERLVCLCDDHAERVREANPESPEELAALFPEAGGRRSLIDRRSPLDRRIFPPRPEGRRHDDGRRVRDAGD